MQSVRSKRYVVHAVSTNRGCLSYVVVSKGSSDAVIIDPSLEALEEYKKILAKLSLRYIIDTHTHADHISAYRELKKMTGAQYVMHEYAVSTGIDLRVRHGDILQIAGLHFKILYTPGHAHDSIVLVLDNAIFTADTLLIVGTGRTDLRENSNSAELFDSIWQKIMPLGDEMIIYPGHDYKGRISSTIGKERGHNPRLQLSRREFIQILDTHHPAKPELLEKAIRINSE